MKLPTGNFGDTLLVDGGWAPVSLAIKRRTLSDWSHVARFVDMDFLVEVLDRFPAKRRYVISGERGGVLVEALPKGVCIRSTRVYEKVAWRVRTPVEPLTLDEQSDLRAWLMEQVGQPYDWRGVLLGHVTRNPAINNAKKWFCSELQAAGDAEMGRTFIADTPPGLVPPHFYAVTAGLKTTDYHIRKPDGWKDRP